jgi:ribosomal protein S27E
MKKENVLNKKNEIDCGNCIFCLSKCPECGSRNIQVRFKPEFEYSYEEGDESIDIRWDDESIEVHCEDCDNYDLSYDSALTHYIAECLQLPSGINVTRNEDRTIDIEPYRFEMVKE